MVDLQVTYNRFHGLVLQGDLAEDRVALVQACNVCNLFYRLAVIITEILTMSDLVDRLFLWPVQLSVRDSIFFQEVAYLVTGSEEVVVANMIILSCGELRLVAQQIRGVGLLCLR